MTRRSSVAARALPPAADDADAFSVAEFCQRHRISIALYYKFKADMPPAFKVGGRVLISREAAAAWRRQRELAAEADTRVVA